MEERKNVFLYYCITLVISLVLISAIVFAVPNYFNNTTSEWLSYCFIVVAFIVHAVFTCFCFRKKGNEKIFLSLPIFKFNTSLLVLLSVINLLFIALRNVQTYIVVLCNIIIIGITVIKSILVIINANVVKNTESNIETSKKFIEDMRKASVILYNKNLSNTSKKVMDALKYANPLSSNDTLEIDNEIKIKFDEFNSNSTEELANDICSLLNTRNELLKR